jgi:hypothetical protein
VLDDEQGIALRSQALERIEQHAIVARVQTDRRLIQDVADTLQVRTQLRSQANPLCLTAGQRRRGTIQRQITESDIFEETPDAH